MNYQELLQINDFSVLFQLVFTVYAAFIAVEYAKSFTSYVINRFYNFKEEIADEISESKKLCREEEMQSIDSDDYFKSGDGLCLVTEYNALVEECRNDAEDIKNSLNLYVDKNTEYRVFRHISLYMVLFSFTFLFVGGLGRLFPSEILHFLLAFTAFSVIVVLAGWFSAIHHARYAWSEKRSLSIVVILFIIAIAFGFLSLLFYPSWTSHFKLVLWNVGMIIAVLLPYFNFVFFFVLVSVQIRKISKHCKDESKPLATKCSQAGELMAKLLIHQEMMNKVNDSKQKKQTGD